MTRSSIQVRPGSDTPAERVAMTAALCGEGGTRRGGPLMKHQAIARRLFLIGAGPRLLGASLLVALLWGGYFWAIAEAPVL